MAEANYAEAVAQQDVISELLGKCFAARTVCEKKDIFEIPFLRSFIPEGRTSFLILASPLGRVINMAVRKIVWTGALPKGCGGAAPPNFFFVGKFRNPVDKMKISFLHSPSVAVKQKPSSSQASTCANPLRNSHSLTNHSI